MLRSPRLLIVLAGVVIVGLLSIGTPSQTAAKGSNDAKTHVVTVPEADRFAPFALTIHSGDVVKWINNDTDDHTVVSDDALNSAGPKRLDHLLQGTDSNGGKPGTFERRFSHAGTFIYYCRFHAQLGASDQPVAPGPRGGIKDANGNFGTPMMGVITVLSGD